MVTVAQPPIIQENLDENLENDETLLVQSGKPVAVFLIATLFNTVLALGVAWVIFSYLLPIKF